MITFDKPGRYEWEVLVDTHHLGTIDMEVVPVQMPPGAVAPTISQ